MQMFRGRCAKCKWEFDACTLPMPIGLAARVMDQACCPMCGNGKANTCAEARELTAGERAHKARLVAAAAPGAVNLCPPPASPNETT